MANHAFRDLAAVCKGDIEGRCLSDLAPALGNLEEPLRHRLETLRASLDPAGAFTIEHETQGENSRILSVRGCLVHSGGDDYLLVTFEVSITRELNRSQNELRALAAQLFTSQEEERRRLARELHDDVSQKLALLEIDAQQAEPKIASNPGQGRRDVERLRNAIGALSEEVRRIAHGLHPAVIEDLGITPAIRALVQEFGEREAMKVAFRAENVPACVPLETAVGLYRIARGPAQCCQARRKDPRKGHPRGRSWPASA